jgi:opacity protein-like surface antigen
VLVLAASAAEAQSRPPIFTGLLTGHIGAASQGDVRDWTFTPGVSMAVLDDHGLGAEVDLSYSGDYDTAQFAESSITTLMVNFVGMYPRGLLRPYVTAGGGVAWLRAAYPASSQMRETDLAWNVGGGLVLMMNDALAFRGDVRYIRNFGQESTIPLGNNGDLDFLRTSFGISYTWPIR